MTQTAFYRNSSNAGTLPFTNRELTIDIFGMSTRMIIAQTDNAPYVDFSDWILCGSDDNLNLADYYPSTPKEKENIQYLQSVVCPPQQQVLQNADFTAYDDEVSVYDTNSESIRCANEKYFHWLSDPQRTDLFIQQLKHTDFEDGTDNDTIGEARFYVRQNRCATVLWLNMIFLNHQDDASVLAGLLRVIACVCDSQHEGILFPVVQAGLSCPSSAAQEGAIMVAEEWRTKNCLDALKSAQFASMWIADYADKVQAELEKELFDDANKNDR